MNFSKCAFQFTAAGEAFKSSIWRAPVSLPKATNLSQFFGLSRGVQLVPTLSNGPGSVPDFGFSGSINAFVATTSLLMAASGWVTGTIREYLHFDLPGQR